MKKFQSLFLGCLLSSVVCLPASAFFNFDIPAIGQHTIEIVNQVSATYGKISKGVDIKKAIKQIGEIGKAKDKIQALMEKSGLQAYLPKIDDETLQGKLGKPQKSVKKGQSYVRTTFFYPVSSMDKVKTKKFEEIRFNRMTYELEVIAMGMAWQNTVGTKEFAEFKSKEEQVLLDVPKATDVREDLANNMSATFLLIGETMMNLQLRTMVLEYEYMSELKNYDIVYDESAGTKGAGK